MYSYIEFLNNNGLSLRRYLMTPKPPPPPSREDAGGLSREYVLRIPSVS